MKKTIATLSLLMAGLFAQYEAQAQNFVDISDANLRNALKTKYPTCFNSSSQLDTICAQNAVITTLDLSGKNIANLEGIRYFKKLTTLYCTGNQLVALPKLPPLLQLLNCSANQLASLSALPVSLETLNCAENQLTSLPALSATNLKFFDCSDNQLTSMPALPTGLFGLYCNNNQLTSLPALPTGLFELYCNNNQLTSLPVITSQYLNVLYCNNNQLTSLPALPNSLDRLVCNDNQLTSLPTLSTSLDYLMCYNNPLSCLPLLPPNLWSISITNTNISCIPNQPLDLTAIINGDSLSYTTLPPVCNPTNNSEQCNVFPQFSGYVFLDANSNGIKDALENGVANVKITTGTYSVYSDMNGFYTLAVPNIGTFTASVPTAPQYFSASSASQTTNFTALGQISQKDFALTANTSVNDLFVSLAASSSRARPGFKLDFSIYHANKGTIVSNGSIVKFVKPALYTIDSTSIEGYTVSDDTLIWNVGTLNIGYSNQIIVYGKVSTAAILGSTLPFWAGINKSASEQTPTDNTRALGLFVTGSFDPNDKQAREVISPAQIAAGEYIDYTIRFQNTGTDTAFTVVIADTLVSSLQANTLEVIASSHNVRTSVKGNVVYFEHLNIQLPDSNANEPRSHGFVSFRIKPQANLALGTNISNKAAIYFDYNAPVITNTAVTKVQNPTGIFDKINKTLATYPNPVENGVLYVPNMAGASATLTSLEGKELRNWSAIGESVSLEGIAQGMYLLKVTQKSETRTAKVMVK